MGRELKFTQIRVGDLLPELVAGPVSRTTLALYAGASADHNPMHIDLDFARRHGREDVFAHGMLSMAYLARLLTSWAGQQRIVRWNVRFVSITPVLATVICSGEVIGKSGNDQSVRVALKARVKDGPDTLVGEATLAFS